MRTFSHAELHSAKFNQQYFYDGELGVIFNRHATTFRLWAPTATNVTLLLHTGSYAGTLVMERGDRGQWETTLPHNVEGTEFTY